MSSSVLTLLIRKIDDSPESGITFDIILDGIAVAENVSLSKAEQEEIIDIGNQHSTLYGKGILPATAIGFVEILGGRMFRLWLQRHWEGLEKCIQEEGELVISSDSAVIHALPWEMIGLGKVARRKMARWRVARMPSSCLFTDSKPNRRNPGQLRVLMIAPSPSDMPEVNFDRQAEMLHQAVAGINASVHVCEGGSQEDLRALSMLVRPHVVHLEGFAISIDRPKAAFEEEFGATLAVSSEDLINSVSNADLVVICASPAPKSPFRSSDALALDLVRLGQKAALAIPAPLPPQIAVPFFKKFYKSLSEGENISTALAASRGEIEESHNRFLPSCYSCQKDGGPALVEPSAAMDEIPVHGVLCSPPGMEGLVAAPFIGRRRMISRLYPSLRKGLLRSLLITGHEGSGKSAMAYKLAALLSRSGIIPAFVQVSRSRPLLSARIIEAAERALNARSSILAGSDDVKAEELRNAAASLASANEGVQARLKRSASLMAENRILLLIDGLEHALDESIEIKDPDLSEFYSEALRSGRCIITSTMLPAKPLRLPEGARNEWMGDISQGSFENFMLLDHEVSAKFSSGEISYETLRTAAGVLGRSPGRLRHIRSFLSSATHANVEMLVGKDGAAAEQPARAALQEKSYEKEVLSYQFEGLSDSTRRIIKMASNVGLPLTVEILSDIAGEDRQIVSTALSDAERAGFSERLPGIHGELWTVMPARWLSGQLHAEEKKAAAKRIAAALMEPERLRDTGASRLDLLLQSRWLFMEASDYDAAVEANSRICNYLARRGLHNDVIALCNELIKSAKAEGKEFSELFSRIGLSRLQQGEYEKSIEMYEKALSLQRGSEDKAGEAASLHNLGLACIRQGKMKQAYDKMSQAMLIYEKLSDNPAIASCSYNHGLIAFTLKDLKSATESLSRALKIQKEVGDSAGQAASHHALARAFAANKDAAAAREHFIEAYRLLRDQQDLNGAAAVQNGIAQLELAAENYEGAEACLQLAYDIVSATDNQKGTASTLHALGSAKVANGKLLEAAADFSNALDLSRSINDKETEASSLFQIGIIAIHRKMLEDGLKLITMSAIMLRSMNHPDIKHVEPFMDRISARLGLTEAEFMKLATDMSGAYRRDRGASMARSIIERIRSNAGTAQ